MAPAGDEVAGKPRCGETALWKAPSYARLRMASQQLISRSFLKKRSLPAASSRTRSVNGISSKADRLIQRVSPSGVGTARRS